MPGIVGIIKSSEAFKPDVSEILDRMAEPLRYKADQTVRHFIGDWFACAVIDYGPRFPFLKSASAQKDGVLLLMEGEVFPDAAEVPHDLAVNSPTVQRAEYCLHLYLKDGPKFVHNLNGVFSIAVIDQRERSVHLYTDRFGHRLMFTAEKSSQFAFASSVRSFLRWRKDIGLNYDKQSIDEFVMFERVLGDRTLFPDIKRLLPATHATWSNSRWGTEIYYEMHMQKQPGNCRSWKDGSRELLNCLGKSLAKRTSDQSKAGLLLSGGLDSRLVLLACPNPLIAASFSGSQGQLSIEAQIANKIAKMNATPLFWLPRGEDYYAEIADLATEINEGLSSAFSGCHSLGVHHIMDEAGFQVAMTGDRFDAAFKEFWVGLSLESQLYTSGPMDLDARRAARIIADSPLIRRIEHQDLMMLSLNDEMKKQAVMAKENVIKMLENFYRNEIGYAPNDINGILRLLALGGPFWQGFTAMGMIRGLASQFIERSPFFDNEMLNLSLSLPVTWTLRGRIVRNAIKLASPRMARIPDVNTRLPAGLCPPWDNVVNNSREYLLKIARYLSKHSKQVAKFRQPRPGTNLFSSRHWRFSLNGALLHNNLYRQLVEDAVKNAPHDFFDPGTLEKLLCDDLNYGSPRMWKLWHMLVSFRSFDKTWGPHAPR
jgi:asparagine synthetase B (glutamine-hydrolysing)